MNRHILAPFLALILAIFIPPPRASAVPQRMVFNDEATTLTKGTFEFETASIWEHGSHENVFTFKHELEFGLTDNLELDVYLSEWDYTKSKGESGKATWGNAGLELIYAFSNPTTDIVGSALSLETQFGKHGLFELEPRLRLQKNVGPFTLLYNVGLNASWSNEENSGEFFQALGAAYRINSHVFAGVDLTHNVAYPGWSNPANELYLGPTLHLRSGSVWLATEMGFKLTAQDREAPAFRLGIRFGFSF
jgi:hypothetical protein